MTYEKGSRTAQAVRNFNNQILREPEHRQESRPTAATTILFCTKVEGKHNTTQQHPAQKQKHFMLRLYTLLNRRIQSRSPFMGRCVNVRKSFCRGSALMGLDIFGPKSNHEHVLRAVVVENSISQVWKIV